MDVAGSLSEFFKQTKRLIDVLEPMLCEDLLPRVLFTVETLWQDRSQRRLFQRQELGVEFSYFARVLTVGALELVEFGKLHQSRDPQSRHVIRGDGMGLQVVLHLQPVFDIA